ncbi:MAG: hypothetical protein M3P48_03945 [Actinomycetota bacterium]|nr:hypothetical protein [Actinomycetota bacterium]
MSDVVGGWLLSLAWVLAMIAVIMPWQALEEHSRRARKDDERG